MSVDASAISRPPDWPPATCCFDTYRCYCGKSNDPDRIPRPYKGNRYDPPPADVDRLAGVLAMIQHRGDEANARADLAAWRPMAERLLMSDWFDDVRLRDQLSVYAANLAAFNDFMDNPLLPRLDLNRVEP